MLPVRDPERLRKAALWPLLPLPPTHGQEFIWTQNGTVQQKRKMNREAQLLRQQKNSYQHPLKLQWRNPFQNWPTSQLLILKVMWSSAKQCQMFTHKLGNSEFAHGTAESLFNQSSSPLTALDSKEDVRKQGPDEVSLSSESVGPDSRAAWCISHRTYDTGNRHEFERFKKFIKGTLGERYWWLWMDIERLKALKNTTRQQRYFPLFNSYSRCFNTCNLDRPMQVLRFELNHNVWINRHN